MRFRSKNFNYCQILKQKFFNVSDFEIIFLQGVRFWIRSFTTRQTLKNNIFLKSMILRKKKFLTTTILKKNFF